MIAGLDMYSWPETRDVFDGLWRHCRRVLADQGLAAPESLTPCGERLEDAARQGKLILGQICGITFARANHAQPCYQALAALTPDDDAIPLGCYRSVIIANKPHDSLAALVHKTLAVNSWHSYSGWYALRHHLIKAGFSDSIAQSQISGAHRQSVALVASGKVDWAAIDEISWGMLKRIDPALCQSVHLLDHTAPAPGLPFVTSHLTPPRNATALTQALIDYPHTLEGKAGFHRLGLKGIAPVEAAAYAVLRHHAGDC
jgi:ABC-type phosphate/phosphonate transport system substrate-binding protein